MEILINNLLSLAAVRHALPTANPSIYLNASLGMTLSSACPFIMNISSGYFLNPIKNQ
jgi:hypothetical protein